MFTFIIRKLFELIKARCYTTVKISLDLHVKEKGLRSYYEKDLMNQII